MKRAHEGGVDYERPEMWRLTNGEEESREKREKEKKKRLAGGRNGMEDYVPRVSQSLASIIFG